MHHSLCLRKVASYHCSNRPIVHHHRGCAFALRPLVLSLIHPFTPVHLHHLHLTISRSRRLRCRLFLLTVPPLCIASPPSRPIPYPAYILHAPKALRPSSLRGCSFVRRDAGTRGLRVRWRHECGGVVVACHVCERWQRRASASVSASASAGVVRTCGHAGRRRHASEQEKHDIHSVVHDPNVHGTCHLRRGKLVCSALAAER
jgi:hypothetical protein